MIFLFVVKSDEHKSDVSVFGARELNNNQEQGHKLFSQTPRTWPEIFNDMGMGEKFEHTCPDGCMFASLNIWSTMEYNGEIL